ncbi:MAG: ACP S-malonyltransferase [Coriobacteriia bacterium]|nr:ACP S-malonyltransferase [Coriobacteriia bacterium]
MSYHPTVMVFPGQGSQYPGMLDAVPENDTLHRLVDAAEALSGIDLRAIAGESAAPESLADTRVAQPLLYLTDWAWGVSLLEIGLEPVAVAGHSLGELAALAIAGAYSVEAGLELVIERSRLMAQAADAVPGTMAAVLGLSRTRVSDAISPLEGVWVANDNSKGQVVISGTSSSVAAASGILLETGARRVVPLKVAGAFHSPLMEPARHAFEELLSGTEFRDATIPVIQNTDPFPATDAETLRFRLAAQISAPVRWTETVEVIAGHAPVVMIEAGPGVVLRGLARGVEGVTAVSVEDAGLEHIMEEVIVR